MNVETGELKTSAAPPPPPPPPPTARLLTTSHCNPVVNHSLTNGGDGRSKLLADICKGTALKKISVTDKNDNDRKLNHNIGNSHDIVQPQVTSAYDAQIKSTKDLLQSELSNTLKRRKPVAIVDPPKYQYPTALDNNTDNNIDFESIKPINVNHTLAVVSSIKLPEGVNVNITTNNKATTNDKPMIGHAKPNFTLPRKKSESSVCSANGSADAIKSPYRLGTPKTKTIIQLSHDAPAVSSQVKMTSPQPPPLPVKLPPNQSAAVGPKKSIVPNETNDGRKLLMSHGKPNFVASAKIQQQPIPHNTCRPTGIKETAENYLDVKIKSLKPQRSVDDSWSSRIAEKKAIFEKPSPTSPFANAMKSLKSKETKHSPSSTNSNEIHRTLNRLRSTDASKENKMKSPNYSGQTTPDSSNDSGHSSPLPQPTIINKSAFEQHVTDAVSKNMPNGRKTSASTTTNFAQRTIVSFSKDLNDSPNRYPEHVQVTKTMTSNTETTTSYRRQEAVFDNIRFSINDQAQVIHKLKH